MFSISRNSGKSVALIDAASLVIIATAPGYSAVTTGHLAATAGYLVTGHFAAIAGHLIAAICFTADHYYF
ncbi:hypothetical protein G9A89_021896 [Geosiphon pyriformis]|nr:hypothetical protein G9A89_021896 [Geosiphon pyriformis]